MIHLFYINGSHATLTHLLTRQQEAARVMQDAATEFAGTSEEIRSVSSRLSPIARSGSLSLLAVALASCMLTLVEW